MSASSFALLALGGTPPASWLLRNHRSDANDDQASDGERAEDGKANQGELCVFHYRLEVSRFHRILWLLEELQMPHELETCKRTKERLADPALKEIHPLGKSLIVTMEVPGRVQPLVLAESAAIIEYLCDYYGRGLVPKRYQEGKGR